MPKLVFDGQIKCLRCRYLFFFLLYLFYDFWSFSFFVFPEHVFPQFSGLENETEAKQTAVKVENVKKMNTNDCV